MNLESHLRVFFPGVSGPGGQRRWYLVVLSWLTAFAAPE
ncbi:hypothetical protein ACP_0509 [Acidobacterium capsulatum ATCC 51196]|uniref:Uncharacterized protein n=1 Tax=Acidobacterium capsulatum (strain ATCC 51196 / DSM 11244 / BCRC 80197 / JCM 7670 / NBRC 15755 / NCIMB 13165 / 161) TaxID=240015 RepID=C1F110_ACIC5|nr:hypothetical protein ACP_0509 [Acidobacterium capsulatum ATCC 51196]